MIDTTAEELISLSDAIELIPGKPHLSQVYRWARRGLRGVKLEWVRCGGRRYTSREAITRFITALTIADGGDAPIATPTVRRPAPCDQALAAGKARTAGGKLNA
jgi:hypothetical protein